MKHPINDIEIFFSRIRNKLPESTIDASHNFIALGRSYSLVKFVLGEGNRYKALISAGIHGDEPSGIETICAFLENNMYENYLDEWELTFLPCINPYGYEYGTRENHYGNDLNRLFKHKDPPVEVKFAKGVLEKPYELSIELHEDCISHGYYLYQLGTHSEDDQIGKEILKKVKYAMPINLEDEIDGHSAQNGIMIQENDFKSMEWWPMALYSISKGTRRCLTLETATNFPMATRVKAQLIAIDTALNYFSMEDRV
jgi:murein peptide amidase A